MALSELKLNSSLVSYLRKCARRVERGEILEPGALTPHPYSPIKRHVRDRLTEAEINELIARYQSGELRPQLAEEYGISVSSVARLLRRHGIRRYRGSER